MATALLSSSESVTQPSKPSTDETIDAILAKTKKLPNLSSERLNVSRSYTIQTGASLNPKIYTKELLFATSLGKIKNPRVESTRIDPERSIDIPELEEFSGWIESNVAGYYKHQSKWSQRVAPERFLLCVGLCGMGRLFHTVVSCWKYKINLLFVRGSFYEPQMYTHVYKRALELQPVIVFIDNPDNMFANQNALAEIYYALNFTLDKKADNVWSILATKEIAIAQIAKIEILGGFVKDHGSMIYIRALNDVDNRTRLHYIRFLLTETTMLPRFPPESDDTGLWEKLLVQLANFSRFCTLREIETFINNVWRAFYHTNFKPDDCDIDTINIGSQASRFPSLAYFGKQFSYLPFRTDNSDFKSLAPNRDVYHDFKQFESDWESKYSVLKTSTPCLPLHKPIIIEPRTVVTSPAATVFEEQPLAATPPYFQPSYDELSYAEDSLIPTFLPPPFLHPPPAALHHQQQYHHQFPRSNPPEEFVLPHSKSKRPSPSYSRSEKASDPHSSRSSYSHRRNNRDRYSSSRIEPQKKKSQQYSPTSPDNYSTSPSRIMTYSPSSPAAEEDSHFKRDTRNSSSSSSSNDITRPVTRRHNKFITR